MPKALWVTLGMACYDLDVILPALVVAAMSHMKAYEILDSFHQHQGMFGAQDLRRFLIFSEQEP